MTLESFCYVNGEIWLGNSKKAYLHRNQDSTFSHFRENSKQKCLP